MCKLEEFGIIMGISPFLWEILNFSPEKTEDWLHKGRRGEIWSIAGENFEKWGIIFWCRLLWIRQKLNLNTIIVSRITTNSKTRRRILILSSICLFKELWNFWQVNLRLRFMKITSTFKKIRNSHCILAMKTGSHWNLQIKMLTLSSLDRKNSS